MCQALYPGVSDANMQPRQRVPLGDLATPWALGSAVDAFFIDTVDDKPLHRRRLKLVRRLIISGIASDGGRELPKELEKCFSEFVYRMEIWLWRSITWMVHDVRDLDF